MPPHYLSHRMIHFDIPWSLMVFQQRNGRIDRYGQERTPHILYLVTESRNAKIRGDTRILHDLERLQKKQYEQLDLRFKESGQSERIIQSRKEAEKRKINQIFDDYLDWVEDTMTTEDNPYIQVIAVLRGVD